VAIWYIFPCFGILNKEKSGNPAPEPQKRIKLQTWEQCWDSVNIPAKKYLSFMTQNTPVRAQ
jgi:hypothetical protein